MVVDPVCPAAGVSVAVQLEVAEPQPGLMAMPELGSSPGLLLLTETVSVPDPESVNPTAAGASGEVTD